MCSKNIKLATVWNTQTPVHTNTHTHIGACVYFNFTFIQHYRKLTLLLDLYSTFFKLSIIILFALQILDWVFHFLFFYAFNQIFSGKLFSKKHGHIDTFIFHNRHLIIVFLILLPRHSTIETIIMNFFFLVSFFTYVTRRTHF